MRNCCCAKNELTEKEKAVRAMNPGYRPDLPGDPLHPRNRLGAEGWEREKVRQAEESSRRMRLEEIKDD